MTPWNKGFPGDASGKEPACQCRRQKRHRFHPWVGQIPSRRAWQPTPVSLPGESHRQRSLEGYSLWGRRVRHDWSDLARTYNLSQGSPLDHELHKFSKAALDWLAPIRPSYRNLRREPYCCLCREWKNPKVMLTAGDENSKLLWLRCQLMGLTQRRLRDSYCILELCWTSKLKSHRLLFRNCC